MCSSDVFYKFLIRLNLGMSVSLKSTARVSAHFLSLKALRTKLTLVSTNFDSLRSASSVGSWTLQSPVTQVRKYF